MKTLFTLILTVLTTFTLCSQSLMLDSLNINNINVIFYSTGLFTDYEINPGSNQHTIYSGNIWMGGEDINNQIKLAAETYAAGDFFYGPSAIGVSSGNQNNYNYVWKITRQEIEEFRDWYLCNNTPGCVPDPNYTIPNIIVNWPANGDISMGYDLNLAPYYDFNGDGIYIPTDGDYPCIKGDMAIFTIFNDVGIHTTTGGDQIGAQIRAMHYAFNSDPSNSGNDSIFQNTIFSEYSVSNQGTQTLYDFRIGIWEDGDIGCPDNDYAGCDISRGLTYTYNGTTVDNPYNDPCPAPFGANPPAQGTVFLRGLKQDSDGLDNPLTTDIPTALSQSGLPYDGLGCNYGDGTADNESRGLDKFIYFDRNLALAIYGDPSTPSEYYNYLNGIWKDGSGMVYGGTGHISSGGSTSNPSDFAFPGDSDPYFWNTGGVAAAPANWSEATNSNPPGDRRTLSMMAPITFQPFEHYEFAIARITGRDTTGNLSGLDVLFNSTDVIRDYYACQNSVFDGLCNSYNLSNNEISELPVQTYPNPVRDYLFFNYSEQLDNILIYSISGELVKTIANPNATKLDLSDFQSGMYLIEFQSNNNTVTKRVVKE